MSYILTKQQKRLVFFLATGRTPKEARQRCKMGLLTARWVYYDLQQKTGIKDLKDKKAFEDLFNDPESPARLEEPTKKQREAMEMMLTGSNPYQIAEFFGIDPQTVYYRIREGCKRLGVKPDPFNSGKPLKQLIVSVEPITIQRPPPDAVLYTEEKEKK